MRNDGDFFKRHITNPRQIKAFIAHLKKRRVRWDRLVCSVGSLLPAQDFFECDFDQWQDSVLVNAIRPLRLVPGWTLSIKKQRGPNCIFCWWCGQWCGGPFVRLCDFQDHADKDDGIYRCGIFRFDLHVSIIGPGMDKDKDP